MSGSHLWGFMEVSGRPLWVIKNLTLKLYNQTKTNSSPKLFCTRDTFFFRLIVSHAAVQSSSSWFIEQCCTQVWIRSLMNWVFWITRISNQKAILHIQSGLLGEALVTSTVENHQLWTTCSLLMQSISPSTIQTQMNLVLIFFWADRAVMFEQSVRSIKPNNCC